MESLIIVIVGIAILIFIKIYNTGKYQSSVAKYIDKLSSEIDMNDYNKQANEYERMEINLLQDEFFFTKDYIYVKELEGRLDNPIINAKQLKGIYHYVFVKSNLESIKIKKYIVLELLDEDAPILLLTDTINKKQAKDYFYKKENISFNDKTIILIKELYPHIQLGFKTNKNDVLLFTTHSNSITPTFGVYQSIKNRNKK